MSSNKILAIDFGTKNIGLAISQDFLASPLTTIRIKDYSQVINKLAEIIAQNDIKKIVIGISERKMAQVTKKFSQTLAKKVKVPITFWDETLTSQEAWEKMVEARKSKKARKNKEHQFAAALILQEYLDTTKNS
jgi:putative Holliday junction resolvase